MLVVKLTSGFYANELVSALEKIGAIKTAEIYKKAVSIYGDKVPTDRDERETILTPDDKKEEERIEEILNECDDAFFEYEDEGIENDAKRDEFLTSLGIKVLRYSNLDVNQRFESVCQDILNTLDTSSVTS